MLVACDMVAAGRGGQGVNSSYKGYHLVLGSTRVTPAMLHQLLPAEVGFPDLSQGSRADLPGVDDVH